MKNIYNDFNLQREDILARIAKNLELDSTRRAKMEQTYKAVSDWLSKDNGFFKNLDIDIFAQGSARIFTTVKPYNGEDFDLDIVLHIKELSENFTPQQIYNELIRRLKENEVYKNILEGKNRCARLNYSGDFHMDILPGCTVTFSIPNKLNVPDRKLSGWSSANPKDLSQWFLEKANNVQNPILEDYYTKLLSNDGITLEAETENLPKENFYQKKPLQRATQLVKRQRDIYFDKKTDHKTSSIILTTLLGELYEGENTIYSTINNFLEKTKELILKNNRIKVFNPINPEEEFTEKWDENPELYKQFKEFIKDFYIKWQLLKSDFSKSGNVYEELFGDATYKDAIIKQTKLFSKIAGDKLMEVGGIILGNNSKTDNKGNINIKEGRKNEYHRDFGDDRL